MTRPDAALALGGSLILHGPLSDRAYLARLDPQDAPAVIRALDQLAREHGYGKIFAKAPQSCAHLFLEAGYVVEAVMPGMYPAEHGTAREHGLFLARFLDPARQTEQNPEQALLALRLAGAKAGEVPPDPPDQWDIERLGPDDAEEMARLYDDTFRTYPFPINDPGHLRENMADHVFYYGARSHGGLVALAGCETDPDLGQGEMTDFGSLPDARGFGAAFHLLERMEHDMRGMGLAVAFTISRALSVPINVTFARRGYGFGGTLLSNTNISGSLESMNVWFKDLRQPQHNREQAWK